MGPCTGNEIVAYGEDADGYPRCCPWQTWNEATYRSQIGESTYRYVIEAFVKKNLWWLTEEGLDNAAWDAQTSMGSLPYYTEDLVNEAGEAIQNLHDIFQNERWIQTTNGKPKSSACGRPNRHWYAMVVSNDKIDFPRVDAALRRVLPAVEAEALIASRQGMVGSIPFFDKAWELFQAVPRMKGQGYDRNNDLVGWPSQVMPLSHTFTIDWQADGRAKPSGWAQDIIDHFRPQSARLISAARASSAVSKVVQPVAARMTAGATASRAPVFQKASLALKNMPDFTPDGDGETRKPGGVSTATGLVLATASLGLVGAGYWFYRRRRKSRVR